MQGEVKPKPVVGAPTTRPVAVATGASTHPSQHPLCGTYILCTCKFLFLGTLGKNLEVSLKMVLNLWFKHGPAKPIPCVTSFTFFVRGP